MASDCIDTWLVHTGSDAAEWIREHYLPLWEATGSNPFFSPTFVQRQVHALLERHGVPVVSVLGGDRPRAVWFLRREGRTLRFLDDYIDEQVCIARDEDDLLAGGIEAACDALSLKSVVLMNVPEPSQSLERLRSAFACRSWFGSGFPAWMNLQLRYDGDDAEFLKSTRNRSLRNHDSRLQRLHDARFEHSIDGDGLDAWVDEFCAAHKRRWAQTSTPSVYWDADEIRKLRCRLHAWQRDGVLIRFSLRADGRRVAWAICLLQQPQRVVYYHVANEPEWSRLSAARVLLRRIILWAHERGIACVDFGTGDEPYKFRIINHQRALWRLVYSRYPDRVALRGWSEATIRANPVLQRSWDRWVNQGLRPWWGRLKR